MFRRRWHFLALAAALLSVLSAGTLVVTAENVDVSIGVGDTVMVVQGSTSPSAFVTIKDGDTVIGTTTADGSGRFSQTFGAVTPGLHNVSVFARDEQARATDTITINANVAEHQTTIVEIFLPPTIQLSATDMSQGTTLTINGSTYPAAIITLALDNTQTFIVSSDGGGLWSFALNTASLAAGQHSIYARATDNNGNQSYPTEARTFTISPANAPAVSPPLPLAAPTITQPVDGAVIQAREVLIAGTAPAYAQIELWDGNQIIGSVVADANGRWQMLLRASKEAYSLRARACSGQNCSRFSNTVNIRFAGLASRSGFMIILDHYRFLTQVGQPVSLVVTLSGGPGPYQGTVYWGDGSTDNFSTTQNKLKLKHTYTKKGLYNARISAQNGRLEQAQALFSVAVQERSISSPRSYWWLFWLLLLLAIMLFGWVYERRRRASKETKKKLAHKK